MHVDQVGVVAVQLEEFVLAVHALQVDVVLNIDMFVGQNVSGFDYGVAGRSVVVVANVFAYFALVDSEVEILLADNFLVSLVIKGHLLLFVLVVEESQFLSDNRVHFLFDLVQVLVVSIIHFEGLVNALLGVNFIQLLQVVGFI